jgi:hypothetical protein
MECIMEYSTMTKAVTEAVRGDINSVNKWQTAGQSVREFFGTESAITEVKAQFIADAIMPAIDKRHAQALAKDLPRKGSADYVAFVGAHGADAWEVANQAKKDARSVAHTMFARVVKYAFPSEKTETTPRDLKTRLNEELAALVKACQKAEAASFDVGATITALEAALSVINK